MSGTDLPDGTEVRKGAVDAVKGFVRSRGGNFGPISTQLTSEFPGSEAHL